MPGRPSLPGPTAWTAVPSPSGAPGNRDRALPSPKGLCQAPNTLARSRRRRPRAAGPSQPTVGPCEAASTWWHHTQPTPQPPHWRGVSVGPTETPGVRSKGWKAGRVPTGSGGKKSPTMRGDARAKTVRPWGSLGGTDACQRPHGGCGGRGGARAESAAGKPAGPARRKEAAGRKPRAARPHRSPGPRSSLARGRQGSWPELSALVLQG